MTPMSSILEGPGRHPRALAVSSEIERQRRHESSWGGGLRLRVSTYKGLAPLPGN